MGVYVNDNGTLRQISRGFVNDNGTLREVLRFSVNDNGTLRHIFMIQAQLQNASSNSSRISPTDAFAGFRLNSNGNEERSTNNATVESYATVVTNWLVSGANSAYECKMTQNSGSALSVSDGLGTWLVLSSSRRWGYLITGLGTLIGNFTIEIRRASDQVVLATATVDLSAEVTA